MFTPSPQERSLSWRCEHVNHQDFPGHHRAWMMVRELIERSKETRQASHSNNISRNVGWAGSSLSKLCYCDFFRSRKQYHKEKYVSCTSRWSKMENLLQFLLLTWCSDVRGSGYSSKSFLTPLHNCGTLGKLPNLSVSQFRLPVKWRWVTRPTSLGLRWRPAM